MIQLTDALDARVQGKSDNAMFSESEEKKGGIDSNPVSIEWKNRIVIVK